MMSTRSLQYERLFVLEENGSASETHRILDCPGTALSAGPDGLGSSQTACEHNRLLGWRDLSACIDDRRSDCESRRAPGGTNESRTAPGELNWREAPPSTHKY